MERSGATQQLSPDRAKAFNVIRQGSFNDSKILLQTSKDGGTSSPDGKKSKSPTKQTGIVTNEMKMTQNIRKLCVYENKNYQIEGDFPILKPSIEATFK